MADPVSFVVAEWTLSGVIGGLYRVLSEIHRLIVTAPREQEANAALAAELDKLMLLCGSKVHEFRSRAVYQAPGAVDALGMPRACTRLSSGAYIPKLQSPRRSRGHPVICSHPQP